jgi:alanine racemase
MKQRFRPTWAEIDLDAIAHNVRLLKPAGSELMAVVKADGYGHGAIPVAKAALAAGATWVGVSLVEEGLALREAGIDAPVLVLSELPEGSHEEALEARLTPCLYSEEGLARLAKAAAGEPVPVHVKIDSGMHRVGIHPAALAVDFVERVEGQGLVLDGLWTHFSRSEEDEATTSEQLALFLATVEAVRDSGHEPRLLHAANTGATIRHPESHLDLVRPGIGIYGLQPAPGVGEGLRPALRLRTEVAFVKRLSAGERASYGGGRVLDQDSWVATLPVGYADGYPRTLSSRADVLLRAARCRVAWSVTMDQTVIDCGDVEPDVGEEVVLIGRQGDSEVSAWELAGLTNTVAYEIVARIGKRVPREYIG